MNVPPNGLNFPNVARQILLAGVTYAIMGFIYRRVQRPVHQVKDRPFDNVSSSE